MHSTGFGSAQHASENVRKHVSVFVTVNMRHVQGGGLEFPDLRFSLVLDLIRRNMFSYRRSGELLQAIAKPWRAVCESAGLTRERRTINEDNMTSRLQTWLRIREGDRFFKGR